MEANFNHDELIVAAAILKSEGLSQEQIAKRLGRNQPAVSRFLQEVKDKDWLNPNPQFTCPNEDLVKRVRAKLLSSSGLKETLLVHAPDNKGLRQVTVVDTVDGVPGSTVVGVFRELLADVSRVGVTWGRTIRKLTPNPPNRWEARDWAIAASKMPGADC